MALERCCMYTSRATRMGCDGAFIFSDLFSAIFSTGTKAEGLLPAKLKQIKERAGKIAAKVIQKDSLLFFSAAMPFMMMLIAILAAMAAPPI